LIEQLKQTAVMAHLWEQSVNQDFRNISRQSTGEVANQISIETKLYNRRWAMITIYTFQLIIVKILLASIGVINNIYKAYFGLSYFVIDWFTLIQIPAKILATFVLSILTFNSLTNSRKLFIFLSFCSVFSCACSLISFAFPDLYAFIFLGQFGIGFGSLSNEAIISSLASNWFPENQIGLALSTKTIGSSIGSLLGFLIPSQLFKATVPAGDNETYLVCKNTTDNLLLKDWCCEVRSKFFKLYGSLLLICIINLCLVLIIVAESPPKPPTIAQALKPRQVQGKINKVDKNIVNFFKEIKNILFSAVVFQLIVIASLIYVNSDLQKLLMGEIFREGIFFKYHKSAEAMAGYALVLFELGCLLGGILSAKLTDKYKMHKLILCIILFLSMLSVCGLVIARYLMNTVLSYISNTFLGFLICVCFVPIFDLVLQHTYPQDPVFVMLLFMGACKSIAVIFEQICRLLLNFVNEVAVFVFMFILLLIALILCAWLQPKYHRGATSSTDQKTNENSALLNSNK